MHREQDYLSEEELKQLIEETEHGEMLKAPVYLKSEIMDKIRMEEKEKKKKVIEMPQRSGRTMTEKALSHQSCRNCSGSNLCTFYDSDRNIEPKTEQSGR